MKSKILLVTMSLLLSGSFALAESESKAIPIRRVIDVDLTKNATVQIVVNVVYPNGCYRPDKTLGVLDQSRKTIELNHVAAIVPGFCTQALVPRFPVAEIERPQDGVYKIIDAADGHTLGIIRIGKTEETQIYSRQE